MAQRTTLTEQQVAILRWIAEGSPPGVMQGTYHRISAAALRNRGLVKISGRSATWRAEATQAGRDYLARLERPNPPLRRQANVSVTAQLVADVIAASGCLRLAHNPYERGAVDYVQRARLAERYRKVPAGKRLTVECVGDKIEIRLVDTPYTPDPPAVLEPVQVPARVGRYHPAARHFREHTAWQEVSSKLLPRATRIVHAIAVEAERRNWSAEVPEAPERAHARLGWTATKYGHLAITTPDASFWLRLREEGVSARGIWEEEVERRNGWRLQSRGSTSVPRFDAHANGRLKLTLFGDDPYAYYGRQSTGPTGSLGRSSRGCPMSSAGSSNASWRPSVCPRNDGSLPNAPPRKPGSRQKSASANGTG